LLGINQFNQREYFECHETLEALWNREPGTIRVLAKGILQLGVGCYHLLRGNRRGALLKLASGADYLEPFAPRCRRVDVAQLIADARRLHAEIAALSPDRVGEIDYELLPIIQVANGQIPHG
jgi:predicted metal-dependent hydrolase